MMNTTLNTEAPKNINADLFSAIESDDRDAVIVLLNQSTDGFDSILLFALEWRGADYTVPVEDTLLIESIVDKGADVNIANLDGETPVIIAAWTGKYATVKLLLQHNADVNARDKDGYNALIAAAQYGYSDIVVLLLEKEADINAQTNEGLTALMRAASQGHAETVALLLSRHADATILSQHGDTALSLAEEAEEVQIVHLLKLSSSVSTS